MDQYKVIGVMSGTSLDGLDVACCTFEHDKGWRFELGEAVTVEYPVPWRDRLAGAMDLAASELAALHSDYGHFVGQQVKQFMRSSGFKPDLIASHGHTVFHRPDLGYTLQVGDGNAIAAATATPVVFDFRSLDVALGGQGAPLVPVGDRLLFGEYGVCLNIGGIANLSHESGSGRIAYDICPANMLLNHLAQAEGVPFDRDGRLARQGSINVQLFDEMNALGYYQIPGSKTLGREWFLSQMLPILGHHKVTGLDMLRTATEHIALQVAKALPSGQGDGMLVTGGGAHNSFLLERIRQHAHLAVFVPEQKLIDFKEALVFALLGVLRVRGEVNCLASVTGATRDGCGGILTA